MNCNKQIFDKCMKVTYKKIFTAHLCKICKKRKKLKERTIFKIPDRGQKRMSIVGILKKYIKQKKISFSMSLFVQ